MENSYEGGGNSDKSVTIVQKESQYFIGIGSKEPKSLRVVLDLECDINKSIILNSIQRISYFSILI